MQQSYSSIRQENGQVIRQQTAQELAILMSMVGVIDKLQSSEWQIINKSLVSMQSGSSHNQHVVGGRVESN
jgi:hypothetical protein